jgi:outer membrane protein assembly factor BamB
MSCSLLLSYASLYAADQDNRWPSMRGPHANGYATESKLATTWSETEHITWKTPIPGEGWSSPVIADGAIWLTTALDEGKSRHVVKIDAQSGAILFSKEIFAPATPEKKHARNSYASPSPVLVGDNLYVHFGTIGTACLSAKDGSVIWQQNNLHVDYDAGSGGSPTHYQNLILLTFDGMDVQFQVALDAGNGNVRWKTDRSGSATRLASMKADTRKAFGTPFIMNVDGKDLSINTAAHRLYAYEPLTGKEVWFIDYPGFSNAAQPVTHGNIVVINTGFPRSELWAITPSGAIGDATKTNVKWTAKHQGGSQASPIIVDDLLYAVNDSGILNVFELETGTEVYKERLGVDFAASPIYANGLLYFADARGKTTVLKPGRTFTVIAANTLEEGCMASPAALGNSLFLRTKKALYRIDP